DGAHLFHDAHPGRWMGGADWEGVGELAAPPPPSNGGGCSTGCQSFLSFVITPARMFLSGQFSPVGLPFSILGPPFSMRILPMKAMPSNCLRLTVRAACACGLLSSGSRPSALSRIALSVPRLISLDLAWPSVVPSRTQYSKILRPLYNPSAMVITAASISHVPSLLRVSIPSSPTPPALMCRMQVGVVPCFVWHGNASSSFEHAARVKRR